MNVKEENQKLVNYWNEAFEKIEPMLLQKEDVKVSNDFDRLLKQIGDQCSRVLDIGCGWGYCLLSSKLLGKKIIDGIGVDSSEHAIRILNGTCENSSIDGIKGVIGRHDILKQYEDQSFDGVICSNLLDVIPEVTSNEVIDEIKRLIKPKGLLLLKFNFYLTDEIINRIGMKEIEANTYTINGVLRGVNYTLDEWLTKFGGFELVEKTEFERVQTGPKDRVLLLKRI